MSSTSFITLPLLIKLWIVGVLFYIIHNTSTEFKVSTRNQILMYVVVGTLGFYGLPLGLGLSGNSKALRMNREESELVKDYLKHRRSGETLGDYLTRMEAEEGEDEDEEEDTGMETGNVGLKGLNNGNTARLQKSRLKKMRGR